MLAVDGSISTDVIAQIRVILLERACPLGGVKRPDDVIQTGVVVNPFQPVGAIVHVWRFIVDPGCHLPEEKYDPEELLEKLDFAVITAREALDRAVMPWECQN